MTRPQWWLDPMAIDLLALCEHLDARTSPNPHYIDDFVAPSGNRDLRQLISFAEDEGFLRSDASWADAEHVYDPVVIMPPGTRRIGTVAEHRSRRYERTAAARQGLLLWLYDQAIDDPDLAMNHPSTFLEADPPYNFWGEPFTIAQVREATEYLLGAGLLELYGERLASGEPQNVMITGPGKNCVEVYGGIAPAYVRAQGAAPTTTTFNQTFHGPFHGQNAQGGSVIQNQHNGVDPNALASIFADLRALLSQVDDHHDRTDLTVAIDDLERAATTKEPDLDEVGRRVGLLNRLASRVGNTAVNTSTSVATSGLLDLLGGAIS